MIDRMVIGLARKAVALVVGAIVLASCALVCGCGAKDPPTLSAPEGRKIAGLVWLPDGWLYMAVLGTSGQPGRLMRTREDVKPQQVEFAPPTECVGDARLDSIFRVENRLGLVLRCIESNVVRLIGITPGMSGQGQVLATLDKPVADVAWDTNDSSGFISPDDDWCRGLGRVDGGGLVAWEQATTVNGAEVIVDANVSGESDCARHGGAGLPWLSPDGTSLFFVASAASNSARWASGEIKALNLASGMSATVVDEVSGLFDLAVAPHGGDVVFTGRVGTQPGLWRYSNRDRKSVLLSSEEYAQVAIAPDGGSVAAVWIGGLETRIDLYRLD